MRILTNVSQAELSYLTSQPTAKAMIEKVKTEGIYIPEGDAQGAAAFMAKRNSQTMDTSSIGSGAGFSQAQVTENQFYGFTKDGKKIVQEISASGVVSVKIDPEGEKADAERTKKLREIMQKVYAGTKLAASELAFLRSNYPDTYQSVVEKEKEEESLEKKNDKYKPTEDAQNLELIELLKKIDLYA